MSRNSLITKMGVFLVDRLKLDQPGKGKSDLKKEILALETGRKSAIKKYYVRKMKYAMTAVLIGVALSILGYIAYRTQETETYMQTLVRPGYGEDDRKEALYVQLEGEEPAWELEVTVQGRKYTDNEKRKLLDQAIAELEDVIPDSNDSMDEVRNNLVFPESMMDDAVQIEWLTIPYGVIDHDGTISTIPEESGTLVEIRATLSCQGMEAYTTFYAMVYPPVLTEDEQVVNSIRKEVELADARDSYEETLELPVTVDGRAITWKKESENPIWAMLVFTLLAAAGVCLEMDSQIHQKAENRKKQLLLDYPDLMWKMTMLLGAGLSIKSTFARISEEYRKESGKMTRYVYEEVSYTCYEMQSGVPEAEAYERFGKRCDLPEYIRMGSVLSQNLKKGAKGLTALLQTEAEASLNERKNNARRIGERAGTKLLLPMVMMLGIVLVILMVPAFLSF